MSLPLKTQCAKFFFDCLEQGEVISGCERFSTAPEGTDIEIWLYGLLAEYSAMSQEDRVFFNVEYPGISGGYFNGNYYAQDVVICPN